MRLTKLVIFNTLSFYPYIYTPRLSCHFAEFPVRARNAWTTFPCGHLLYHLHFFPYSVWHNTSVFLVQSLNSPFFPPHIGTESGRAEEESRITCMRMLRTNQSKITRSQPYYAVCVNVSRNDRAMPFSARALLALWKLLNKKHFLWRWYCGRKQIEMWFIGVCTLMVNEYASQLFSQTFFRIVSACWAAKLRKFLKGKSDAYK